MPLPYNGYTVFSKDPPVAGSPPTNFGLSADHAPSIVEFLDWSGIPPWAQGAYNKAYSRFREKALGEGSALGTLFAEWRESLEMVYKRTTTLYLAYRALRKGKFREFLKALSINPKRKHKGKIHNTLDEATGLWLEYWFGWSPTLNDIYGALEVLGRPLPEKPVKGTATGDIYTTWKQGTWLRYTQEAKISHKVQGTVILDNPNLFYFNQLGLINPVAVLWEVIPFSFLVDWVFDVGSFIESFTDFVGVTVVQPFHSHFLRYNDSRFYSGHPDIPYVVNKLQGTALVRSLGIARPIPSWSIHGNLGTSITRAATAVSLLTQVFTGGLERLHRT